jgi:hypothetical protein
MSNAELHGKDPFLKSSFSAGQKSYCFMELYPQVTGRDGFCIWKVAVSMLHKQL